MFASISTFDFFFVSMIAVTGAISIGLLAMKFIADMKAENKANSRVMAVRNK